MAFETLKRKLTDQQLKEAEDKRLRDAAIATRSALRFAAYEANPRAVKSAFRVEKTTPRGLVTITVNPENPVIASWIQKDISRDYIETKRYKLSIGVDGEMTASTQTHKRIMNEVPISQPLVVRFGPIYYATREYPSVDTHAFDKLEKGLHNFSHEPQSFTPSVGFLDGLRRDILRDPIHRVVPAKPVVISGDLTPHQVIAFPHTPLSRVG